MSSEILSFLTELSQDDAIKVLQQAQKKSTKIKFKAEESDLIERTQITTILEKNRYVLSLPSDFQISEKELTFKIEMGTDHYFFKAPLLIDSSFKKRVFVIELPFTVFHLIRRKNTRYVIPEHWPQTGSISVTEKYFFMSHFTIIDISLSGLRIHVIPELPRYEKGKRVKLTFKINRRSEISVEAFVRHVKHPKKGGQVLGLEFILDKKLTQSKIENICSDIIHALA